jgi:hypothetical protein
MERYAATRALLHGTGVSISRVAPLNPENALIFWNMARGDLKGATDSAKKSLFDLGRQKGLPFATQDFFNTYDALTLINEMTRNKIPVLNILPSQISEAQSAVDVAYSEFRDAEMNGISVDAAQANIDKAESTLKKLENKYYTNWDAVAGDALFKNVPFASLMGTFLHPFTMASFYRDEMTKQGMEAGIREGQGRGDYTGPFTQLQVSLGLSPADAKDVRLARSFFQAIYGAMTREDVRADVRLTPEQANDFADLASRWDAVLTEADAWVNYMVKQGGIEGEKTMTKIQEKQTERFSSIPPRKQTIIPDSTLQEMTRRTQLAPEKKR